MSLLQQRPTRQLLLAVAVALITFAVVVAVAVTPSNAERTTEGSGTAASWTGMELTDARTGETFRIADLEGAIVAIEPMAIWCTQCKVQNDNVKKAHEELRAAGVHFISLGVEPGERPEALANYADSRGYDWTFAISPVELSRALADQFTAQILSVPATPLIVLSPDGEVAFQDFGFHGPESLVEITTAAA